MKDIQCVEETDDVSPPCSSPASSTESKHDGNLSIENLALKFVHAIVNVKGIPQRRQCIKVASPRRDAISYVSLRKDRGSGVNKEHMTRPRIAKPKSVRDKQIALLS